MKFQIDLSDAETTAVLTLADRALALQAEARIQRARLLTNGLSQLLALAQHVATAFGTRFGVAPTTQVPEAVRLLAQLFGVGVGDNDPLRLSSAQVDLVCGVWATDGARQCTKAGVLSRYQSELLFDVAIAREPVGRLSELTGGSCEISIEQFAALAKILRELQMAALLKALGLSHIPQAPAAPPVT